MTSHHLISTTIVLTRQGIRAGRALKPRLGRVIGTGRPQSAIPQQNRHGNSKFLRFLSRASQTTTR